MIRELTKLTYALRDLQIVKNNSKCDNCQHQYEPKILIGEVVQVNKRHTQCSPSVRHDVRQDKKSDSDL
jgi:methionyl-tRNA synthetase